MKESLPICFELGQEFPPDADMDSGSPNPDSLNLIPTGTYTISKPTGYDDTRNDD